MTGPVPELADRAVACAERLASADRVLVVSHIDADGLTSAAVAASALRRADIPHEVRFEKQLDEAAVADVAATDYDTVLFTDFGSGQLPYILDHRAAGDFEAVVADHHQPADLDRDPAEVEYHLNPLPFGIDGASELSGAGTAYVLARALADWADSSTPDDGRADNRDLAALAVVGAVGDMQASEGELVGANRGIVEEGVEAGALWEGTDLALYGTQTRPLPKLLEYASDVPIPGVTGDASGAIRFLDGLGLDLKGQEGWRRWVDLTDEEKQTVVSALVQRAVTRGVPADRVNSLVGTTYLLADEEPGTELRDASEFSTLLNATARYERADVGLAVCLGDRGDAYDSARRLLSNHRRNLSEGIDLVEQEGVEQAEHVQWFHAGDRIRETVVGIVAGMAMGADGVAHDKPIVAFADTDDAVTVEDGADAIDDEGTNNAEDEEADSTDSVADEEEVDAVKVSARATHRLVRQGVDLSVVMAEAAAAVGGAGGGHDVAAGATVPAGRESAFVDAADELVGKQLS